MGLTIINETVTSLCKTKHGFSDKEKEFVVQFAFRSGDKTLTNQLIDELAACENEQESEKVMEQYMSMIDMKPVWVSQIENLLVSIEMYRIEEEKAINRLAEVLTAYGVDVTEEQVRRADAEEIKEKVNESRSRQEEEDEETKRKNSPNSMLQNALSGNRCYKEDVYGRKDSGSGTDYPCSL